MGSLKNEKITEKKGKDFEDDLHKFECPFSWDMDIDGSCFLDYKPHDEEELVTVLYLMRIIMRIYIHTIENADPKIILAYIDESNDLMKKFVDEKHSEISIDAVEHVLKATQYHALYKINKKSEAQKILKEIKDIESMNKQELSTIYGCQAMCWSNYRWRMKKSIYYIEMALVDTDSDIWHFILGKNLRRQRRFFSACKALPNADELEAFCKAYEKNKNETFGIFLAQMYREKRDKEKAKKMYKEIYSSGPKSLTVYLRLALGFIRVQELQLAKLCLDKVKKELPEDGMFLHYMGIYYMKSYQFKEAAPYLKKTADMGNYPAAQQYVRCMRKIDRCFNTISYLLEIKEQKNLPETLKQSLLIDIALHYLAKNDFKNSSKYFLDCIKIDPKSKILSDYYPLEDPGNSVNVYKTIATQVIRALKRLKQVYSSDKEVFELHDKLSSYYNDYMENELGSAAENLCNLKT